MKSEIIFKPIGTILTPYTEPKGMPIQGIFEEGVTGTVKLLPQYTQGLKDVEGFSHLILFYYFDRIKDEQLLIKPFLEDVEHGVFAVRTPMRPNKLGISIVRREAMTETGFIFSQVDILDKTPLLDIKPYVSHFDARKKVKNGWIDKHFQDGHHKARTRVQKKIF